jgi:two-component system OmpR family sensor kinase/two-component system sensor histidine kinase BaeS
VGTIALLINRTTGRAFRRYVTQSDVQGSGSGLEQLAAYYERVGSWRGVEEVLGDGVLLVGRDAPGHPNRPPRRLDALLADADGRIVHDSTGPAGGRRLTAREESNALAITASDNGEVIGYLLLSFPGSGGPLGRLEEQFLGAMRRILLIGAALAVALGLVLGVLLSRSLTAPLQRLATAARAVAAGDLDHRVQEEGSVEIVEVAEAFNEMTSALGASERQRQNMVADVAHELRTPLTVIQGNLRAILDGVYPLDQSEVSRLYDESRLLARLVDDLRELAQADAGQLRLNVRPTDVGRVIQSMVENLVPAAEEQGVELSAHVERDLPPAEADADRVAQILHNLLANALRHTPVGGSVTVSASLAGEAVEIAVADTGEGISPEDLPHIFERFWRADPARTRGEPPRSHAGPEPVNGTGLGLSVAQSLVEAQGGRIWAESILGQGSTFRFTLPLAGPPA